MRVSVTINLKEKMPAVFTQKSLDEVPGSSFTSIIIEELRKKQNAQGNINEKKIPRI